MGRRARQALAGMFLPLAGQQAGLAAGKGTASASLDRVVQLPGKGAPLPAAQVCLPSPASIVVGQRVFLQCGSGGSTGGKWQLVQA